MEISLKPLSRFRGPLLLPSAPRIPPSQLVDSLSCLPETEGVRVEAPNSVQREGKEHVDVVAACIVVDLEECNGCEAADMVLGIRQVVLLTSEVDRAGYEIPHCQ